MSSLVVDPDGTLQRPPRMHRRSFARARSEVDQLVRTAWTAQPIGRYLVQVASRISGDIAEGLKRKTPCQIGQSSSVAAEAEVT